MSHPLPPFRDVTVGDLLTRLAEALPDREALVYGDGPRFTFAALERELVNDFHAPMVRAFPALARADEALRAAAGRSLLSGSGSCLFALFESESPAREAAAKIDPSAVQAVFVCSFHHGPAWR